ncbi:hypothetical protein [Streptomyces sp. NPDC052092]|uniref:hypothetical protein n=1 Tax=Streptomyces sp. NPDC052092 TaxID=3365685 RepID=UPI0037D2E197
MTGLRVRDTGRHVRRDNRKQIRPPAGTGIPNEGLTNQWLAAGVAPGQITRTLTAGLPDRFLTRPAGILAFRLRETPLPAPPPPEPLDRPAVLPLRTRDGCDRAVRALHPGHCRDCRERRTGDLLRARAAG